MTESFIKEIKARKKELESTHLKLTNYWIDGKFQPETNFHIGRAIDNINKAMDQLDKLL